MKNRFDEKVKGHGFFRKTKAFGLASGIALGAALLVGANTVSADEVTPAQPATVETTTNQEATIPTTPPEKEKTVADTLTPEDVSKKLDSLDISLKKLIVAKINDSFSSLADGYDKARNSQIEGHKQDPSIEILPELTDTTPVFTEDDILLNYDHNAFELQSDGSFKLKNNAVNLSMGVTLKPNAEDKFVEYYNKVIKLVGQISNNDLTNSSKVFTAVVFDTRYVARYVKLGTQDDVSLLGIWGSRVGTATGESKQGVKFLLGNMPFNLVLFAMPKLEDGGNVVKGSITQKFVSVDGKVLGEKTTGSVPMGSKVTLTHDKTITLDGKTYVFTKQDLADPTEVTDKDVVVTYTYTEQNLTPVDSNAGKPIVDTIIKEYKPNPKLDPGTQNIIDPGKPRKTQGDKVVDPGKPQVIEVGTKPKVVEEEIPFEKKTRENPNLPEGTSKVVQEGKNGKKKTTTTYTLDPKTGKVTPNTPTVETTPPVDQITEIGKGKDKDGDLVVNYIPDPESPQGNETIVDEGSKPKLDITGKVKDPGKPKVIKVGTKPKVVEEEIPFEKKTRENPNLPEGTSKVVQEGKNGKKKTTTTYTLDPKTGKVTPNTPTVETTPPVDQITEIGKGKDKDGDLVVNYIPDPESPQGNETIVDEGSKPKLDITGKVKDPGKPKVIKVGTKPKVVEEEIPFKETVVENPSKPEGSRTVLKEGKVGKKTTTTTYTLDPKTGKVTPNTTTSTTPPEDRLIEVGTGKNVDGDIVTEYVPDLELEPGQTKVVQNGTPEVKDVTGKVVTPGTPTIIHIGIKPKVVEENIPFEREYKDNPKLPEGVENVIQKGVNGKKVTTTTYTVDTKTGKVTSTDKVDETPVVNEIVERGTGKNITGEIVVNYVPDPELEPGKTKVVQNGTPEVKDVTGKVVTPGKPTIIHVGTKPKVVEEKIPFKEETRENKDLPKGQTKVVQEGKVGKKTTTTTYEVDPKTGTVTPTEKVEETPAVNKITEIGTKEEAKPTPTPTSQTPAKPQVQEVKNQLPSTGSATSVALTLAGLSVMGLATTMVLKKKEQ